MSSNFARFVGQFWIQNPIILDGFKFSVPLISGGGRAAQGLWTEHQPVGELLVFQPVFFLSKNNKNVIQFFFIILNSNLLKSIQAAVSYQKNM